MTSTTIPEDAVLNGQHYELPHEVYLAFKTVQVALHLVSQALKDVTREAARTD